MKNYTGFLIRRERLRQNLSQEGLCRGICAVSYLSKIEQGLVTPGAEIIEQLFRALGIRYMEDPILLKRAKSELRTFFERFFLCVLKEEDGAWLDEHQPALAESALDLPLRLFHLYRAAYADDQMAMEAEIEALNPFLSYLNDDQLFLYHFGRALLRGDDDARENAFLCAQRLRPCSCVQYRRADFDFLRGRYVQVAQEAEQAYQLASEEGNGYIMLYASALLGMSYANQHHYPFMMRYFRRALALSQSLAPDFAGQVLYNIGATCLELNRYDEALTALNASLEYPFENDASALLTYHKLAIVHTQLGNVEEACQYLSKAEALCTPETPDIYRRILCVAKMRLTTDYLSNPEYTALLRGIYDESEEALHFGFKQFHGSFLIEAYVHQRRYKDALTVSREISEFSFNSPISIDE